MKKATGKKKTTAKKGRKRRPRPRIVRTYYRKRDLERIALGLRIDLDVVDAILHSAAHKIDTLKALTKRLEKAK